jgi:hypothetical protein
MRVRTIPSLLSTKTQLPMQGCLWTPPTWQWIAGGIEALVHTIRGELEYHSLIALDSANTFNSLSPHSAYEAVVKHTGAPLLCVSRPGAPLQSGISLRWKMLHPAGGEGGDARKPDQWANLQSHRSDASGIFIPKL